MSEFNHLDLDGHLLGMLLAVHETQSVTRAAQRLGVTQSAVSHGLDKLRAIAGDPLFVRSGRGIAATSKALQLAERARSLLADMQAFATTAAFDPARLNLCFTIAANDLQRDHLLPGLLRRLRAQAPGLSFRIVSSGAPEPELLRVGPCDLLITPRPPEVGDVVQRRLFDDRYVIYYDPLQRQAPTSLQDYLNADHASVTYDPGRSVDIDQWLPAHGVRRRIVATVPGFAALGALLRGSTWLAIAPSLLSGHSLHDLACAIPPFPAPLLTMYMAWHQRRQHDPVHAWIRAELLAEAQQGSQLLEPATSRQASGPSAAPRVRPRR